MDEKGVKISSEAIRIYFVSQNYKYERINSHEFEPDMQYVWAGNMTKED